MFSVAMANVFQEIPVDYPFFFPENELLSSRIRNLLVENLIDETERLFGIGDDTLDDHQKNYKIHVASVSFDHSESVEDSTFEYFSEGIGIALCCETVLGGLTIFDE